MNDLSLSAHINAETRIRVVPFPSSTYPFISLRLEGDGIEIALLAAVGSADILRDLATAATEAADTLDTLDGNSPGVSGRG
ncbi:hypothetical protein [Streptomyces sp. B27]|uniref:hypothetical protein n=1 Tax=Streptomyces sp. B27 TaxID=2485015 RepID=UPI000FD73E37|nr:hypothetical protein [Streptomyces sp. B27]